MVLNYQDGMAICRHFGAPDLFCTFTCNPKWQEISDALLMEPGQVYSDRPDIVTRVFKRKLTSLFLMCERVMHLGLLMLVSAYTVLKFNVHSITLIVYVLIACELPSYCATMFYFSFADLYVVEFQKRGLPHIHVLIWLKEPTRDVTGNTIDRFVSAEIPDVRTDPLGYAVVEEFMIHGPCGEFNQGCPCMKDGTCSKRYPKTFNEETVV
jgi:hypothetical protein